MIETIPSGDHLRLIKRTPQKDLGNTRYKPKDSIIPKALYLFRLETFESLWVSRHVVTVMSLNGQNNLQLQCIALLFHSALVLPDQIAEVVTIECSLLSLN